MGPNGDAHNLNTRLLRFRSHAGSEDAYALASDLLRAGRYGDARGVAIGAQADDAPDPRLLVIEGRAWYLERDLVRAQAALLRAVQIDPESIDGYRYLGEVLLKRGEPERASRALGRAAALSPGDAEIERLLMRAHQLERIAIEQAVPAPSPPPPAAPRAAAPEPAAAVSKERFRAAPPPRPAPSPSRPMAVAARPLPPLAPPALEAAGAPEEPTPTQTFRPRSEPSEPGFADFSDGALDSPHVPSVAGNVRAPSSGGNVRAPSSGGGARAPSNAGNVRAPSSAGDVRAPSSGGNVRAPSSGGDARAPSNAGDVRAPSSGGDVRAPSSAGNVRVPSSGGDIRAPSSAGSVRVPSSAGDVRVPSSGGNVRAPSSAGRVTAPLAGLRSSPGVQAAPSSPVADDFAAEAARPLSRTSASGGLRSPLGAATPVGYAAPRSYAGTLSSPYGIGSEASSSALEPELDVDLDLPEDTPARDSDPGEGPLQESRASSPEWMSRVSTSPGIAESPLPLSSADDPDLRWDEPIASRHEDEGPEPPIGPVPVPAPDLALGEHIGSADDPDALVARLRERGVLELPSDVSPIGYAARDEVQPSGTRLKRALIVAWAVTLVMLAGGYFGFRLWVEQRHAQAQELLVKAKHASFDGNYRTLLEAERLTSLAREKHPRSPEVAERALLVYSQRLLENGARELSALRIQVERARAVSADAKLIAFAEGLLGTEGSHAEAQKRIAAALPQAAGDPERTYLAGRAAQRFGLNEARSLLESATKAAPDLHAAKVALAELEHAEAKDADALTQLERVLGANKEHLRARLWRAYLSADTTAVEAARAEVEQLTEDSKHGAPADHLLLALLTARLAQRAGDSKAAEETLAAALALGTSEPDLLGMLAREAERAGELSIARKAAMAALSAQPESNGHRARLARILLARGEGDAALILLSELPEGDPSLPILRARAALSAAEPSARASALAGLEPLLDQGSIEAAALELRLRAALEPSGKLLHKAERLASRAPGDPEALRAFGEVALAAGDARKAIRALEQLVVSAPSDPEAHHLLGRAQRMAMSPEAAEASLRKALELDPTLGSVQLTLGSLLLDLGRFADADALYQELALSSPLAGRLGRVEALVGLRKLDDAKVQLEGIPEAQRTLPAARETGARLALARGEPGEAVTLIGPLAQAPERSATVLALYGEALYGVEQVNAAAGAFDAALELDAELPEGLLGRAEVCLRAERPDEALELLERAGAALEHRLRAPELLARRLTLLGHAHVQRGKRGDLDAAREALLQAVALPTAPNEAHFWLGEADGGRRTPQAAAAFKRYLELEPEGKYADRARRALGPLL